MSMKIFLPEFAHLLVPFILGTTVVSIVSAGIGYYAVKVFITRFAPPLRPERARVRRKRLNEYS